MTDAERKLWQHLRKNQINNSRFYRQKPIGNYIVDFYCPKLKLVIEIDGDQHYYGEVKNKDTERDLYLKQNNIEVLRFGNNEVFNNTESVIQKIWMISKERFETIKD